MPHNIIIRHVCKTYPVSATAAQQQRARLKNRRIGRYNVSNAIPLSHTVLLTLPHNLPMPQNLSEISPTNTLLTIHAHKQNANDSSKIPPTFVGSSKSNPALLHVHLQLLSAEKGLSAAHRDNNISTMRSVRLNTFKYVYFPVIRESEPFARLIQRRGRCLFILSLFKSCHMDAQLQLITYLLPRSENACGLETMQTLFFDTICNIVYFLNQQKITHTFYLLYQSRHNKKVACIICRQGRHIVLTHQQYNAPGTGDKTPSDGCSQRKTFHAFQDEKNTAHLESLGQKQFNHK